MARDPFALYTRSAGRVRPRTIGEVDPSVSGGMGLRDPYERYSWRVLGVLGAIVCAIVSVRLAYLQIIQADVYVSQSEGNRVEVERIMPLRGIITDSSGTPLVKNVSNFELIVEGARVHAKNDTIDTVFGDVRDLLSFSDDQYAAWLAQSIDAREDIIMQDDIPYADALRLMSRVRDSIHLRIETAYRREYPYGEIFSHVLGYNGRINAEEYAALSSTGYALIDDVGKTGVEKVYESSLRGTPGVRRFEVDNRGRRIGLISTVDAIPGVQLELGIDTALQQKAYDTLKRVVDENGFPGGSVVAIDPNTGRVRALVSYPSYNNNDFVGGIDVDTYQSYSQDERLPLFHRALSGQFPSGSVFKPIVAAAALETGIASARTTVNSVGGIEVGGARFPDWRAGGHGITDVYRAIAQSVNTYFYMVGGGSPDGSFKGLGPYKIAEYAESFGLGKRTGIDLPGEAKGFVPTPEWKEEFKNEPWYLGDTYHFSIGQGDLLVTPIQVATYTAAIANGGTLYSPRLAQAMVNMDTGERTEVPSVVVTEKVVSDSVMRVVRDAMHETVLSGSARMLLSLPVSSAGKTGTAQYDNNTKSHSWFTSFAPYDNPELVLTVMIEAGGAGSGMALPAAKEILQQYFSQQ